MELKSQNHKMEHLLGKLRDYKSPTAEPDWDAFYNKHKNNIGLVEKQDKTGLAHPTASGWERIVLFSAVFALMIFTGIYFYWGSTSPQPEQTSIPANEQHAVDPGKYNSLRNEPDKTEASVVVPVQTQMIIDENVTDVPGRVESPEKKFIREATGIPAGNENPDNTQPVLNDELPAQVVREPDRPVVIKKTIVVKDTIRVTRKIKKK